MGKPRLAAMHKNNFGKVIRVPPEQGKQLRTPLVNHYDGFPCPRWHVGFHGCGRACHRFGRAIFRWGWDAEEINALPCEKFLPNPHIMARLVIESEDESNWSCRQILRNAERATREGGAKKGRDLNHNYQNASSRGILLL